MEKDKSYYHFQRINDININWKVGEIITFSKRQNNFYYNELSKIKNHSDLKPGWFEEIKDQLIETIGKSNDYSILQQKLDDYIKQIENPKLHEKIVQFVQEIVFEQIRAIDFPELPSRLKCIWVTETKEEMKDWEGILYCLRSRILELKINGIVHKTSGKYIDTTQNKNLIKAVENARKYWSPKYNPKIEKECLAEGEIEIIKELIDE